VKRVAEYTTKMLTIQNILDVGFFGVSQVARSRGKESRYKKKKEQKIVFDFFIPYIQSLSVVS